MRIQRQENIDERAQSLFKMLVEQYLLEGEPVPSKRLAASPGVDISAATVRNIMAEFEAQGFLRSPHTSAGKVPTNLGLRFFVDTLLSYEPLEDSRVRQLESELNTDLSPNELVVSASRL